MKKSNGLQNWLKSVLGAVVLLAVLAVGLNVNSFVSLADSAGKITATSAKVRKEPSTNSETVGSAAQNAAVRVAGQTTGSDGYTWYKVTIDGVVGYIRSDLMEITDGSSPASLVNPSSNTTSTPTTSTPDETLVEVAEVEPVSAVVSGGSAVRVRQNASTTSRIVTTAEAGDALTVIGQATGTDNKDWYQVNFIANGSEVSGFIRADYVSVSGELVPAGSKVENEPEPEPPVEEPKEEAKAWETYYSDNDSKWHLVDNTTNNSYDIAQIFSSVEANTKTLQEVLSENKTQQIIIIILVILVILLATGISFLIFKLKDMTDSAYFNQVEQETARRRTADRPVSKNQSNQKVMQTVGAEGKKRPNNQQRPAGTRPAGNSNGQPRPTGQRPAGSPNGQSRPAGQRPAGNANGQARPTGQRPAGSPNGQPRPAGQRPAGTANGQPRPAGQRPAGSPNGQPRPTGQRPAGAANGQPRPAGQSGGAQPPVRRRPVEVQEPIQEQAQDYVMEESVEYQEQMSMEKPVENAGWKAKNFVNEDEFEFQFLDWSDEEK